MSCYKVESIVGVDERGQMVLPKDIRERANIRAGDKLAMVNGRSQAEIFLEGRIHEGCIFYKECIFEYNWLMRYGIVEVHSAVYDGILITIDELDCIGPSDFRHIHFKGDAQNLLVGQGQPLCCQVAVYDNLIAFHR